jgi:pimeloyl-ACP methyl ester carboxylesterase
MAYVTVGEENGVPIDLHYSDHGTGPTVVLIHGWPLSSRTWEKQVPALIEAGHRVITYDRRGFGQSSQPWAGYDFDTFAADLHALLTALDLREVTLVGFSMGGGEVARYIGTYGTERVAAAVFAGAVPPFIHKSPENPDGWLDDATVAQFRDGVREDRLAFLDGLFVGYFGVGERTDLVSEPMRAYHVDIAAAASPKATLDCIGAFAYTDFRADLTKVTVPTLVLHSDADALVPFEASGKRTLELVPGSRLALIEDAPHGFNTTHADAFNAALVAFLPQKERVVL